MSDTLSTFEFFQRFPNEEAARNFFEKRRWNDEPVCGHCGSVDVSECKDHKPMAYRCKDCRKHFSVRTGTVLAESRLPLLKWLLAIYILTSARKGIPSTQMARELGVTQKTGWYLAQRIRETWMGGGNDKMDGQVQVDETYNGDKEKNNHSDKKLKAGHGAVGKVAVVGMRDENDQVSATPVKSTGAATLVGSAQDSAPEGREVVTDEFRAYNGLTAKGYTHKTLCHSAGEYVRDIAHTNGIKSFWSLLKRGYIGVYHYMSEDHLHRYINEFSFRRNMSKVGTVAFLNMTIDRMVDKRLTYTDLING